MRIGSFRPLILLGLLLLLCSRGAAQESPTPSDQAAAARTALAANDGDRLAAIANGPAPDPWLVVEHLRAAGAAVTIRALAEQVTRPDVRGLRTYVRVHAETEPDREVAAALRAAGSVDGSTTSAALDALARVRDKGTLVEQARVAAAEARLLKSAARVDEAIAAHRRAATRATEVGWLWMGAQNLDAAAKAAYRGGDLASADSDFRALARVHKQREDTVGQAASLRNVAACRFGLADMIGASEVVAEAVQASDRDAHPGRTAKLLVFQARIESARGRYRHALQHLRESQSILSSPSGTVSAEFLDVLIRLGRSADALEAADRLLSEEKLGSGTGRHVSAQRARALIELQRWPEAVVELESLLELTPRPTTGQFVARTQISLGWCEIARGNVESGIAWCRTALEGSKEDPSLAIYARQNIGDGLLLSGKLDEALAIHREALTDAERMGADKLSRDGHWSLARIHRAKGDLDTALRHATEAVDRTERMVIGLAEGFAASARQRSAEVFDTAIDIALAKKDNESLFAFVEKSRARALLESMEDGDRIRAAAIPEKLRLAEQEARAAQARAANRLRQAVAGGALKEIRACRKEADATSEALQEAILAIRETSRDAGDLIFPQTASLSGVRAALRREQRMVLYALTPSNAVALVIGPKAERVVDLGDPAKLESMCATLDVRSRSPESDRLLAELGTRLVSALRLGKDVKRVEVSPSGALFRVPFAALLPGREVAYVPSASTWSLLLEQRAQQGKGVLAYGDPVYEQREDSGPVALRTRAGPLARLPGSGDEARAVSPTARLRAAASETSLRADLTGAKERLRAVHLACHGLLDTDQPLLSSLALTGDDENDGFVTALEILELPVRADLATLSACETGLGKVFRGEGLVGLTRSFMYAGTPRVLCSQWKVDDEATRALMVKFYELWRDPKGDESGESSVSAAAALRAAQEHVRAQEKWKHPYYWAGWALWGLGD